MANFVYLGPEPEIYVGNIYEYHVTKTAVGYWMCISAAAEGNFLQFMGITNLVRVPKPKILEGTMEYHYGTLIDDNGEVVVEDLSFYLAEDNYCTYQDILFHGSLGDGQPKYGVKLIKSATERDVSGLCDILDANATFNLIQDTCGQNTISKYVEKQDAQINKLTKTVYDGQERVNELDKKVDELEEKHEQDIATVEQHIQQTKDEVIDYFSIRNRFVYDGPEENLMIIR